MAPISMNELRRLKRVELQALAKENNIKANLKTDALVEALAGVFELTLQPNSATNEQTRPLATKAVGCTPSESSCSNGGGQGQEGQEQQSAMAAKVDSLVALVATLQSELREARQTITNTRELLEAQRSGSADFVSAAEVKAFIETALDGHRRTNEEEAQNKKDQLVKQFRALQEDGAQRQAAAAEESARLLERLSRLEDAHSAQDSQATALAELSAQIYGIESRLETLERSGGKGGEARNGDLMASPTGSDAPPTQTLISFSSPAVTPLRTNTAASESRLSTLKSAVQSGTPGPLALPSHMLAAAQSATRRTPRAACAAPQPKSPVLLQSNASLGKRGRSSDASDLSVVVGGDAVTASTPHRSEGGFHTAPSSFARFAPNSTDNHAYKRLRTSASPAATPDGAEPIPGAISSDEGEDDHEDEAEAREYTVRTKTGSSPVITTGGIRSASITRDPSFFASRPVSPSARPARSRASSVASNADENVAPSQVGASRKSLPLSTLPFPIVSPYRRAVSKSSAPTPSAAGKSQLPGSLFGAPTTAATPNTRGKSGFGDFFSGLDSVNRAGTSRRTSLFAGSNSLPKKANLPTPTPPASRTLFGTEVADNGRFGDAGAEVEEEEDDDLPRLRWGAFTA